MQLAAADTGVIQRSFENTPATGGDERISRDDCDASRGMNFSAADKQHLDAAQGWLGLGDWTSANEELETITLRLRAHPDVLRLRFDVYAKAGKWEAAADVARAISELVPDSHFGFVYMAHALHELQRYQAAWNVLIPIVDKFPDYYIIHYDLACYACRLGNLKEAWQWLEKAIDLNHNVLSLALDDEDLEPMWPQIGEI